MPAGTLRQYFDVGLATVDERVGLLHLAEGFVHGGYGVRVLAVVQALRLSAGRLR